MLVRHLKDTGTEPFAEQISTLDESRTHAIIGPRPVPMYDRPVFSTKQAGPSIDCGEPEVKG